ncbi:MAG TPA: symmetrical bis(5'-nucleosyl)-tetraphosphatase [Nitrospira sp.]|nr:symmetrical bis(5'-nucleosyl)-tetraphosphatase [Nitrospira sp.]
MSTYAIGDVQGCYEALQRLLQRIRFTPESDRLWFVGDLVNRGPDSLGVLRYIKSLGDRAIAVLGNHDLFLLAAAEGIVALRPKDTIQGVLAADDRAALIHWLRHVPLHHHEGELFMVHAGLLPQWTIADAVRCAQDVEAVLSGPGYRMFLQQLFHGPTPQWTPSLSGMDRLVSITHVLTRLRTCTPSGELSNFSGPPENAPAGFAPWFRIPDRRSTDAIIITGHWASLGLQLEPDHLAIDSGCVWGRQLTAVRLEDRKVFQVEYADG